MTRNVVEWGDGVVRKVHGGPDAPERAATAAAAIEHAHHHGLQVPRVLDQQGPRLTTTVVAGGLTGDTLLRSSPATVLHAIGSIARRLHALEPPSAFPVPPDGPRAWVHGDLCPVNLVFGTDHVLRAVVDWEDSHVGDPLVDLAWSEWLVRTWHPDAVEALPVLYAAYGRHTAAAVDRRRAMRACLTRHAARGDSEAAWDDHLAALDGLDLVL